MSGLRNPLDGRSNSGFNGAAPGAMGVPNSEREKGLIKVQRQLFRMSDTLKFLEKRQIFLANF